MTHEIKMTTNERKKILADYLCNKYSPFIISEKIESYISGNLESFNMEELEEINKLFQNE